MSDLIRADQLEPGECFMLQRGGRLSRHVWRAATRAELRPELSTLALYIQLETGGQIMVMADEQVRKVSS